MRRKAAPKRKIKKDPIFDNEVVSKFINVVMKGGKKSIAEKIVYGSLDRLVERSQSAAKGESENATAKKESIHINAELRKKALDLFNQALDAVRPTVEVKSRRVGGSTYQIPIEVAPARGVNLAMRWIVTYAALRSEKSMILRLANEMLDAMQGRGGAIKKREDMHRIAKANQAFAHFRW